MDKQIFRASTLLLLIQLLLTVFMGNGTQFIQGRATEFAAAYTSTPQNQTLPNMVITLMNDSKLDLYLVSENGTNFKNLTYGDGENSFSSASPDGTQIVFVSNRTKNSEIYLMNIDGANVQQLTHNKGFDAFPAWSPDGKQIVFVSDRDEKSLELYVMKADGSSVIRLTNNIFWDSTPTWSPNGKQIAFVSNRDDNPEIYTLNIENNTTTRLTYNSGFDNSYIDENPTWAPDGNHIAFHSFRNRIWEIYIIDLVSGATVCYRCGKNGGLAPEWSPDGKYIAFIFDGISVANMDGDVVHKYEVKPIVGARERILSWVPAPH